MTRLTDDDVKGISNSLETVDQMLLRCTGMSTFEMACDAAGVTTGYLDLEEFRVGVVPVTSGMGVITRFSESVADICRNLGMDAFVTSTYDVTGLAEAVSENADIIFLADDYEFIALNTRARRYSNNSFSTAAGYVSCLGGAAKGLNGKEVLVLGAGRVGSRAVSLLSARGAKVTIADIDIPKAEAVVSANPGTILAKDIGGAISSSRYILNASPAHVDSKYIQEGTIISSPGVPHSFDEEAYSKATIIHDPLNIGVSVMAIHSAAFAVPDIKKCRR
jgi:pyrrolysine biosynthesis protein PylD